MQPNSPPTSSEVDRPQRVLVTGGAGYIGSALLPKLLDLGYKVRLLDLFVFGRDPIAGVAENVNLETISADFRDPCAVDRAMHDVDAVVHLGAIVGDPACDLDHELTIGINLGATRMIAETARRHGVPRFVFASTCSVYGASDEFLNETSTLNPLSLYSVTKIGAEDSLKEMSSDTFSPTFLRFGTIYGLSGRTRFDLVVNLLAAKAKLEGEITVFGGDQWRPFVHVDDAALAVTKVLEAPLSAVHNQAFNVGSDDQNYTISQIAEIVHGMIPCSEIVNRGEDGDHRNYRVDFHKTRAVLGFTPRWTVQEGVQQVIDGISTGRIKDYKDIRYSNVNFFRQRAIPAILTKWPDDQEPMFNDSVDASVPSSAASRYSLISSLLNDHSSIAGQFAS